MTIRFDFEANGASYTAEFQWYGSKIKRNYDGDLMLTEVHEGKPTASFHLYASLYDARSLSNKNLDKMMNFAIKNENATGVDLLCQMFFPEVSRDPMAPGIVLSCEGPFERDSVKKEKEVFDAYDATMTKPFLRAFMECARTAFVSIWPEYEGELFYFAYSGLLDLEDIKVIMSTDDDLAAKNMIVSFAQKEELSKRLFAKFTEYGCAILRDVSGIALNDKNFFFSIYSDRALHDPSEREKLMALPDRMEEYVANEEVDDGGEALLEFWHNLRAEGVL